MESTKDVPVHGNLDRGSQLLLVQTIFVTIAGVFLLGRGYIKCFIIKVNLLDDYLLYGAMLAYAAYSGVVIDGCINGATGKHHSLDIAVDQAVRSLRAWYICMVMYPAITLAIRTSVCVLLLRLNSKRSIRWIIWINLVITSLTSVAFFFILVFQCSPPQYFWRQLYGDYKGYCRNKLIVTYSTTAHSILSALSDWCLGLLPIAILWSVQINIRTKVAIAGLLSLGMIAGVVLMVRIAYVTRLQPGLLFLYESTDVAIWSVMEPALGIIAASVATFRPLFKGCKFGWSSRRRGHSHYQLPELTPRNTFTSAPSPRSTAFNRPFDAIDDKCDPDGGSEEELTIRKTVQIEVTSTTKESPKPVLSSHGGRTADRYSPDFAERAISCDEPYSTEVKDVSGHNNGGECLDGKYTST